MNHLEYDWESPVWRHVFRGLAKDHTLHSLRRRGNGLSDWDVDEVSLDAWVNDLETVVDAAGVERFPLLGISQGCAVSVAYATRHPERVSHLILYGGFAVGGNKNDSPDVREQFKAMKTLIRLGWGSDNPAFRQMFTGLFMPGATPGADGFLQRAATQDHVTRMRLSLPGSRGRFRRARPSSASIRAHARDARARRCLVPIETGRALAAGIPGARFVALQGQNHLFLENEPASERFFEEVKLFLGR